MRLFLFSLLLLFGSTAVAQPMRVVLSAKAQTVTIRPNRSDTIAVNLSGTTSISKVRWNNWNDIGAASGGVFRLAGLKYKATGLASTINIDSIFNSGIITSSFALCTDSSVAPPTALQYYSYTPGHTPEDGALYFFSGFDKTRTYDFVYLPGNGQTSIRTISSGDQSVTQGFAGDCTGSIRLIGLTPDINGRIVIRNRGASATSNVYLAAFYIIEH